MKPLHRAAPLAALAFALLLPTGCATTGVRQRTSEDHSLLVVHIDLSRSPSYWRKVAVLCEAKGGGSPWWHMRTDGAGLYFQEGVPPGRCWITGGFQDGIVTRVYKLPEKAEANPTTTAVHRAGVQHMGSFRYEPDGDDFRLARVKSPGEAEVLRRVLPFTEGTAWSGMVRAKLGAR